MGENIFNRPSAYLPYCLQLQRGYIKDTIKVSREFNEIKVQKKSELTQCFKAILLHRLSKNIIISIHSIFVLFNIAVGLYLYRPTRENSRYEH